MGKKKGKSKAQDEGSTEGAGEAVPGAVAEEKMSLVEEGNSAAPQKPGGGKKGKRDRKKKAVDDDWEDELAEIAAEAGLSVDTRGGDGEGPQPANGPTGGEGDVPPGHSGNGSKKKKPKATDFESVTPEEREREEEGEREEVEAVKEKEEVKLPTEAGSVNSSGGPEVNGGKSGGKKKRKKKEQMDWEDDIEMLAREIEGGSAAGTESGQAEKSASQISNSPTVEPHGDGPNEPGTETETADKAATTGETRTVKTKAEKKAAKKERDKKKKDVAKQKTNPPATSTDQPPQTQLEKEPETAPVQSEKEENVTVSERGEEEKPQELPETGEAVAAIAEGEEEDGEGEGEDKKKKKKKKKKAVEEEKKTKTKKPAKSAILKMKEQIEFMRAEQKRREEEERARILAEEEAQRKAEEAARLEQERKEKKKQKEKERRERRKKEGKPVTKAEREKQAKTLATLQAMKEQGLHVPAKATEKGLAKPGKVLYGKRVRDKKKPSAQAVSEEGQVKEEEEEEEMVEELGEELSVAGEGEQQEEEVKQSWEELPAEEEEDEEESVKDNWDDEDVDEEVATQESGRETEEALTHQPMMDTAPPTEPPEREEEGEEDEEEDEGSSGEESSESGSEEELTPYEKAQQRIMARRQRNQEAMSLDYLRSPVVCVLGHVDTGKTKILDKIRHTNVQDGEAGGITQQIGATFVPEEAIRTQTKMVKEFTKMEILLPGLLIIDTPGHESFSNLRSRGSSMCDLAILVVDIMHGLEPQTLESLEMLRKGKTPFVVALNKIDRLFDWRRMPTSSVRDTVKKQNRNTKDEFEERVRGVVTEFAEQGMNVALFWDKVDFTEYIPLVPTSAHTGDGMGDLISLLVTYSQKVLAPKLMLSEELEAVVLEVKVIAGLGTTIDVILRNGILKEGDTLVLSGTEGPFTTQVRALLMPQPLRELRVKNAYVNHKAIIASQGVKVTAKDLEKTLAGTPIFVAKKPDEIEVLKDEAAKVVSSLLSAIQLQERGVYVQASTLGSLEALLSFLKQSKIPYCGVNIGPVHKRDVMKASVMLEHDSQWAVILAFDVRVEREAQEMADNVGVKIFTADIIYHLFDNFLQHRKELRDQKRREYEAIAIFPCKLRILPNCVFNTRDPIVVGVAVEAGLVKRGTILTVPSKNFIDVGVVSSLEVNHKQVDIAHKGEEVCIKIEPTGGDAPKLYGRHFDQTDLLVSKVSRESIDAVKNYFREDLQKSDWQLFIELKKIFQII